MQKYYFKILILNLLLFILFSCNNKVKVAAPLLSEETLVEVLSLLYINEVKAIVKHDLGVQKNEYVKKHLYPAIFDSLNVEENAFYQSYNYYDSDPSAMKGLMDKVVALLETYKIDTSQVKEEGRSLQEAYEQIEHIEKITKDKKRRINK